MAGFKFPIIDINHNVYFSIEEALGDQVLTDKAGFRVVCEAEGEWVAEHQSARLGTWETLGSGSSEESALQDAWYHWCGTDAGAGIDDLESLASWVEGGLDDQDTLSQVAKKLEAIATALHGRSATLRMSD